MSARGDAKKFARQIERAGLKVEKERRTGIFLVKGAGPRARVLTRFSAVAFSEIDRKQALTDLRRAGVNIA